MRKTIKGFLAGAVIAGAVCFALGYNHGRGAPLLSNPFAEHTLAGRVGESARQMEEKLKEGADEAKDSLRKAIE